MSLNTAVLGVLLLLVISRGLEIDETDENMVSWEIVSLMGKKNGMFRSRANIVRAPELNPCLPGSQFARGRCRKVFQ